MLRSLSSFSLAVRWSLLQARRTIVFLILAQIVVAAGTVIGFSLFIQVRDPQTIAYLVTGGTTFALISVGLVMVPQSVANQREQGLLDYLWTFPCPKWCFLVSEFLVWLAIMLPGMVATLFIASLRLGFTAHPTPLLVPAVFLVAAGATAVGYAIALLSPTLSLTNVLSQLLIVGILLYSPIYYPASRLPIWLQHVQTILPIQYMAELVRGSLTGTPSGSLLRAFIITGAWTAGALLAVAAAVGGRRQSPAARNAMPVQ